MYESPNATYRSAATGPGAVTTGLRQVAERVDEDPLEARPVDPDPDIGIGGPAVAGQAVRRAVADRATAAGAVGGVEGHVVRRDGDEVPEGQVRDGDRVVDRRGGRARPLAVPVQGVGNPTYEANVVAILDVVLSHVPASRVVTIAIPDYTVTPSGADYGDPGAQHDGIVANNASMARLAGERGIAFVDIFDISLEAAVDRTLVADDGLHPSGIQYGRWLERIVPVVARSLASGNGD